MSVPENAMVLAAGLGLRMRPLTDTRPKPLVEVCGKSLIDYSLDHLSAAGARNIVVNAHYKANMISDHLAGRSGIRLIHEEERLETGGGVRNALPHLGAGAFFVLNSDALWLDGPTPALGRMVQGWDESKMDCLLLFQPMARLRRFSGFGDYHLEPDSRARRRGEGEVAAFLFAGVQILHHRLFETAPDGPFSLNQLYDRAEASGRLYGIVHDGDWYHVGTPDELRQAEAAMTLRNVAVNSR